MKKVLTVVAAVSLLALGACDDQAPDSRQVLLDECMSSGGAYFEYEATSAGAHVWCATEDGAVITLDGGE